MIIAFGLVLLVAILISGLAHRTVLSTAVLFLVAGFVLGQGVTGILPIQPGDDAVSTLAELALFVVLLACVIFPGGRAMAADLTTAALEAWLARYGEAWETRDADKAAALFTPEATYHEMPFDAPLALLCHHGGRSQQAAEHFRELGYRAVYNIEGGIDGWAESVDPSLPRY